MAAMKKMFVMLAVFAVVIFAVVIFVNYYSFIFSRRVVGEIIKVERIQVNVTLMQTDSHADKLNPQLYSYAVAIKEKTGEIVTASTEDRQWAVAQPGNCAEAVYYPYPPWKFDKANTYFGARLEKLMDCQGSPPPTSP